VKQWPTIRASGELHMIGDTQGVLQVVYDQSVILRGLNKGQKKEIYFCNKGKIFSSFLLILMHVLHHTK